MSEFRHVKGLAELQKFLDQLVPKMQANVMRGALRAGMKVVLPVARANIHSVSGELAAGLKLGTRHRGSTVIASIKAKGAHSYIAKFVEYGTAAHWISVKDSMHYRYFGQMVSTRTLNRSAKRGGLVIGGNFVGVSVVHPGAKPHPFLRPALDSQAQAAVIATGEYIKHRLATKHGLETSGVTLEADE